MPQISSHTSLGAHEKHGIQAKIGGKIQTVAASHGVCWLYKWKWWNYQNGKKFFLKSTELSIEKSRGDFW